MHSNSKPLLLDLFCAAGGAAVGYHRAGFEVTGVDIRPQPNYPFKFKLANAIDFSLDGFDAIHASPPCQAYTWGTRKGRSERFPTYIEVLRSKLRDSGKTFVIENVVGAPLIEPIVLCGSMFGLRVIRHRLFEINFPLSIARPICHHKRVGFGPRNSVTVAGHGGDGSAGMKNWAHAMGIDWMKTNRELSQAIPPAYTEWLGRQLIRCL